MTAPIADLRHLLKLYQDMLRTPKGYANREFWMTRVKQIEKQIREKEKVS